MANTYSQIYIHIVFAIHNREASISPIWEEQLYKYITGIITKHDQKLLAINGTENHIHFFCRDKTQLLFVGFSKRN